MRAPCLLVVTCLGVAFGCAGPSAAARADAPAAAIDSDHDGLSDALEQELLVQFAPKFQADPEDCAGVPASFLPNARNPVVAAEDGTIYGQATPRALKDKAGPLVELRYFHLWKNDCGRMGHPLDTEHVSVLIEKDAGEWHALYWYAAAHQDTLCDASQIARASTLGAENRGAPVWISRGKHASFLNPELCSHGCGGDKCGSMHALGVSRIVNLGEEQNPMNGSLWIASAEWPIAAKLARSDFGPEALARVERLPASDIAWVNPSKRPEQATIAASGSAADALAMSKGKADTAISLAGDDTGNALGGTYGKVTYSLKKSVRGVGRFVRGGTDQRKSGTLPQP